MKRVLCVWFPHWPLQRICLVQPELNGRAVVLYGPARLSESKAATVRRGRGSDWQVRHCSRESVAAGIRPGMPLAEAQALLEGPSRRWHASASQSGQIAPHFAPHDWQADRKLLQLLAGWCARYSPLVGIEQADEPSALFLDITGCAPLFGGEETMAAQVGRDFERAGYVVRIAAADTIGAAWAAVRFGTPFPAREKDVGPRPQGKGIGVPDGVAALPPTVIPGGRQAELLGHLPVAALRLPAKVIETLHELGIRQIGALQALPRSTLPARFGACVLERLDQALGLREESIIPVPPAEPVEADWSFEEPTADRRALEAVLQRLIGEIAETLAARQEGAQRLVCRLLCAGQEPVQLAVGTVHPTAAAKHLGELVALQLERTTLTGEVLSVQVEVAASGPLESQQHELFDSGVNREGERQLGALLDRLSSRLGDKAVLRPRLSPDPQPEYATRFEAVLGCLRLPANPKSEIERQRSVFGLPDHGAASEVPDYRLGATAVARPLCLKPRPVPIAVVAVVPDGPPIRFDWQNKEHVVRCSWGPERIETGWWRGPDVERDYYRVETDAGRRFWLFRQNDTGKWFLHGAFE